MTNPVIRHYPPRIRVCGKCSQLRPVNGGQWKDTKASGHIWMCNLCLAKEISK